MHRLELLWLEGAVAVQPGGELGTDWTDRPPRPSSASAAGRELTLPGAAADTRASGDCASVPACSPAHRTNVVEMDGRGRPSRSLAETERLSGQASKRTAYATTIFPSSFVRGRSRQPSSTRSFVETLDCGEALEHTALLAWAAYTAVDATWWSWSWSCRQLGGWSWSGHYSTGARYLPPPRSLMHLVVHLKLLQPTMSHWKLPWRGSYSPTIQP
ncbi:hypothetical protein K505DRAFT_419795 [Melanomma pulvis-pyrius CBS 109.77]|uniref:Uncharacterized protein n=1 Tax=Melanomma pulvis-pyrius CBS 109.77 TaxID=1314802 RepID=A0A6A6X2C2_9PLEO|nr:hypothetical protein K505DRAFT_419795 [Melanomma pulvis-pyrius CBS 109.77]